MATTFQVGGSDLAGSIAFDITPRLTDLTLSGLWQQAVLGNGKAVFLNRNTRSVQVVDYSGLDSGDDAILEDGVYPPNLHDFLYAQGYAFGKYYLLDGLLQLHVSADGLTWDDVEVPLQAATFPVHFFTPKGLVIWDQARCQAVMTEDLAV